LMLSAACLVLGCCLFCPRLVLLMNDLCPLPTTYQNAADAPAADDTEVSQGVENERKERQVQKESEDANES
jgi:hypothetical protein